MTEAEWLICIEPERMLSWLTLQERDNERSEYFVGNGPIASAPIYWSSPRRSPSDRKLRLFACGVERHWCGLGGMDNHTLPSLRVAEAWADGQLAADSWEVRRFEDYGWWLNPNASSAAVESVRIHDCNVDQRKWAALLRCIIGNPFRPVSFDCDCGADRTGPSAEAHDLSCPARTFQPKHHSTVLSIARRAYAECDWEALPILADALEEVGCLNEDLLAHLRGPGSHVRGCWALDLLLGKE